MTDFAQSYTSEWRVMRVNQETWADDFELIGVDSISIQKDATDDYPLLETASGSITMGATDQFEEGYYRIEMMAHQNYGYERYHIATLLFQATDGTIDYGLKTVNLTGSSTLTPARDKQFRDGDYAPKGVDGVQYVASLLKECCVCPIETQGSFTLNDHVVFDCGSSYLEAAWLVLDAGGYIMQIDGDGVVHILPKPELPDLVLNVANARLLNKGIGYNKDISAIPNVVYVIDGEQTAEARNDDPASEISTIVRGREVDLTETNPVRVNGETLAAYAERRLVEESTIMKEYSYTREYDPDVYPFSLIRASIGSLDFEGELRVMSQDISCGNGIKVSETAGQEIREYGL